MNDLLPMATSLPVSKDDDDDELADDELADDGGTRHSIRLSNVAGRYKDEIRLSASILGIYEVYTDNDIC